METEREKPEVLHSINPWLRYSLVVVLVLAPIIITLLRMHWYCWGVAWFLALTIASPMLFRATIYVFASEGLIIHSGCLRPSGERCPFIPRDNLIGLGNIDEFVAKEPAIVFRDQDGDTAFLDIYIPLNGSEKRIKKFQRLFHKVFPEAILTDEIKAKIRIDKFGDKLRDVSVKGKPWKALALHQVIVIVALTIITIGIIKTATQMTGLSYEDLVKSVLKYLPVQCAAYLSVFMYIAFASVRELVNRARAKDMIFTVYAKGILIYFKHTEYVPSEYIQWKDILSFSRARIYPWIVIKFKDKAGRSRTRRIPGYLDESDFQEVKSYVDLHHQ